MRKFTNEHGKICHEGVEKFTPFSADHFHKPEYQEADGENWAFHTNLGSLTVVDRMTGFGWRDIESGYRDPDGEFWLASGDFDVMGSGCKTVGEAIKWVKDRANTCVPNREEP
jgi:hypothetical protein